MPRGVPKSGSTTRKTTAKRTAPKTKKPVIRKEEATSDSTDKVIEVVKIPALDLMDENQRQAKLQAYGALKGAGVDIPAELASEVEEWIISKEAQRKVQEASIAKEQAQINKENEAGPWWVRNNYPAPFSLRLERQEKKKRIDLKPRGQRGDLFPLQEGDLDDPILQTNLNTGLIEIVPNGEAKNILSKQTHNLQRDHVPIAILRNEKGEPYAPENLKLETEWNSQGIVVAYEDPSIGKQHENVKWSGASNKTGLIRAQPGQAPPQQIASFVPTGGNPAIISSGFQSDAQARIADDLARRRGTVPQLSVSVAPTERT